MEKIICSIFLLYQKTAFLPTSLREVLRVGIGDLPNENRPVRGGF